MSYTSKCKIRNVREEYSNTTFVENQLLKFFKYLYFFFAFFKVIHDFPSLKIFELLSFKVLWNGNGIRFQSKLERLYKLWKLEVSHWIAQHVHADIIVNSLLGIHVIEDVSKKVEKCFSIYIESLWKLKVTKCTYVLTYIVGEAPKRIEFFTVRPLTSFWNLMTAMPKHLATQYILHFHH